MALSEPRIAVVVWIDSCIVSEQTDELPRPTEIESVGWLARDESDHVVLVRDHHLNPDSYRWRAAEAIPRSSIQAIRYLTEGVGDVDGECVGHQVTGCPDSISGAHRWEIWENGVCCGLCWMDLDVGRGRERQGRPGGEASLTEENR